MKNIIENKNPYTVPLAVARRIISGSTVDFMNLHQSWRGRDSFHGVDHGQRMHQILENEDKRQYAMIQLYHRNRFT